MNNVYYFVWRIVMRVNLKSLAIFVVVLFCFLNAVDLPQFYRAPFFQQSFNSAFDKYTTGLSVRYGHGNSRNAWNGHEETTPLLSAHGYMDITNLGSYVDSPDTVIDGSGRTMTNYWGGANYAPPTTPPLVNPIFPPDYKTNTAYGLDVKPNDGLIEYHGKFEINEWDFTLQQDILWGFFIQAYIPYRDLKINEISYKNLGRATLTGVDPSATAVNVEIFMQQKNGTLNNVLNAMQFNNSWQDKFKKSGVGDILLSAGWHGSGDPQSPLFKRLSAEATLGVLVPTSGQKDINKPFTLPLGTNDSTAIDGRVNAYIQVFDFIGVGAYGGGLVFFTQERNLRVKTVKNQNGWILLEKSFGKVDYGSMWDVGAYAQLGFKGVIAKAGLSFVRQEDTVLTIHDGNLLKNFKNQQLDPPNSTPMLGPVYPEVVSVNSIVNSDQMLEGWEYYTAHFIAGYTLELKSFCPTIFVEYDYPFYGKRVFKTDMLGGTLSLQVKLNF